MWLCTFFHNNFQYLAAHWCYCVFFDWEARVINVTQMKVICDWRVVLRKFWGVNTTTQNSYLSTFCCLNFLDINSLGVMAMINKYACQSCQWWHQTCSRVDNVLFIQGRQINWWKSAQRAWKSEMSQLQQASAFLHSLQLYVSSLNKCRLLCDVGSLFRMNSHQGDVKSSSRLLHKHRF